MRLIGAHISLNALGNTFDDRGNIELEMIALGGGLVMDDLPLAQSLAAHASLPVVHRHYLPDDNELYLTRSAAEWFNIVDPEGANDVISVYHNEPVIDENNVNLFVAKNIEVIKGAHQRKLHVGVGTFSVGNPAEKLIASGAFDLMLLTLDENDSLILHEYFTNHPTNISEYGFLCGRLEWWLERMTKLRCRCHRIIVSEYGRDKGGGQNDGWVGQGWSPEYYGSLLIAGMREIYMPLAKQYGFEIEVDVFCAGKGYGRWISFNVEGQTKIYQALEEWNRDNPMTEQSAVPVAVPTTGGVKAIVTKMPSNLVNVRDNPSGNDVGDLLLGDIVTYFPNSPSGDWVYQLPLSPVPRTAGQQGASAGWVSLQSGAVAFTLVVAPPTPLPDTVTLPKADYNKMLAEIQ